MTKRGKLEKMNREILNHKDDRIERVTNDKIQKIAELFKDSPTSIKRRKSGDVSYIEIPISFDIETTSFFTPDGKKHGTMYIWMMCICGHSFYGRTWAEFLEVLEQLHEFFQTGFERRLVIWVHNLAFEFQFLKGWTEWDDVFAVDSKKPVRALTPDGIEFRCSYILSGMSLADLAKNIKGYGEVTKKTGDLDYSLIRNSETVLTDEELGYCKWDVLLVVMYIMDKLLHKEHLSSIPMTKTGYVRKRMRKNCYSKENYWAYTKLMKRLTITVPEYKLLKEAFQGGFTHASMLYSNKTVYQADSEDFTSSYPYTMIAEKFPMSKGRRIKLKNREEFFQCLKSYACIFRIKFKNIRSRIDFEHYITSSKCREMKNGVTDNGRLIAADSLEISITNIDYAIIARTYEFEIEWVKDFYIYRADYLPTPFVEVIVQLYENKTKLKDKQGQTEEETDYFARMYQADKGDLNSTFGMTVMDVLQTLNTYTDKWEEQEPDPEEAIEKNNENRNRFIFFPWGVFITAWSRYHLWTGIIEFGRTRDYLYSDTDSVKVTNLDKHMDYINAYNKNCADKLQKACDYHHIPFERVEPETVDGVKKLLGVWDYDGHYDIFKSNGAKRYLTFTEGKGLHMTVAGLNKKIGCQYIWDTAEHDPEKAFELFSDGLHIPEDSTGKLTHFYSDEEDEGYLTDYTGKKSRYRETGSICLTKQDYNLKLNSVYMQLLGLTEVKG